MSVYSASKAFDNTLTRALAQEYSDRNIDIVTTTPGPTTSNILKAMDQNRKKEADYKEKIFNFLVVCTP
jgi:short-subunit dehydrogenase